MKRLMNPMWALLLVVTLGLLALIWMQSKITTVATFDKDALVSSFVRQLGSHTLSDARLAQKTKAFHSALTQALNDYAIRHKAVVLDIKQVSAGHNDITRDIMNQVALCMRGES